MKLEQLQQIVEIEKQKSISKAAKVLFMGQPALSASLNSLEEEIGVRLFERNYTGVEPTPEGIDILRLAKQMLDCQSQILNYGETHQDLRGKVTVLIAPAYSFLYSELMLAFKDKYPKAELDLQMRTPPLMLHELANGMANIGLSLWEMFPEYTTQHLTDAGMQYETFGKHSMMVYVSSDSRFANNDYVTLSDLREENFLSYSSNFWDAVNKTLQATKDAMIMTDRESLKRMVSGGNGIALMPDTFALHDVYCENGMIQLIPIKGTENFAQGVDYLIYPGKRQQTLLEQKTLELLRGILTNLMKEQSLKQ